MGEETVYYQDQAAEVYITDKRAILGGETYAMAHVTSVSMKVIPANRAGGIAALVGGIVLGLLVLAVGFDVSGEFSVGTVTFAGMCIVTAVIVGVVLLTNSKPRYAVRIGSAYGEMDALASRDYEDIRRIVGAMNEAIIKRG